MALDALSDVNPEAVTGTNGSQEVGGIFDRLASIWKPGDGCPFCDRPWGQRVRRSKEHVLPQWLRKHTPGLPAGSTTHATGLGLSLDGRAYEPVEPITIHRKATVLTTFTRSVCETCNNGWMSALETAAEPVFMSLVAASQHPPAVAMDRDRATILARWAHKTALTHELANQRNSHAPRRIIHPALASILREPGLPVQDAAVWAARLPTDNGVAVYQAVCAIGATPEPAQDEDLRLTLSTCIVYRRLALLAMVPGLPPPGYHPLPLAHSLPESAWTPIWPYPGTTIRAAYPPAQATLPNDLTSAMVAQVPPSAVEGIRLHRQRPRVIHRN